MIVGTRRNRKIAKDRAELARATKKTVKRAGTNAGFDNGWALYIDATPGNDMCWITLIDPNGYQKDYEVPCVGTMALMSSVENRMGQALTGYDEQKLREVCDAAVTKAKMAARKASAANPHRTQAAKRIRRAGMTPSGGFEDYKNGYIEVLQTNNGFEGNYIEMGEYMVRHIKGRTPQECVEKVKKEVDARFASRRATRKPVAKRRTAASRIARKAHILSKKRNASRKVASNLDAQIFIGTYIDPAEGEWVKLPCSTEEIDAAIERVQEMTGAEEVGVFDIVNVPFYQEYDSPYKLNEMVETVEDEGIDLEVMEAAMGAYGRDDVFDAIERGGFSYYDDVHDESDLGYRIIDELGFDGVDLEQYFDYERFGRDLTFEGYSISGGYAFCLY